MFHRENRVRQTAAAAVVMAVVVPQGALAGPTSAMPSTSVHQDSVTPVRYFYPHRYYRGWRGPAVAGAAYGLFALGAAAAANDYYGAYDYPYYPAYGPVGVYPGYGYGYGGGWWGWPGASYGWRGPVGYHNHR